MSEPRRPLTEPAHLRERLLAAGWLPPGALEQVGWIDGDGELFDDDGVNPLWRPVFVKRGVAGSSGS